MFLSQRFVVIVSKILSDNRNEASSILSERDITQSSKMLLKMIIMVLLNKKMTLKMIMMKMVLLNMKMMLMIGKIVILFTIRVIIILYTMIMLLLSSYLS